MIEEKQISRITDFSEIFMALYSLKKSDKDGNLYFSKNIKEYFQIIFSENDNIIQLLEKMNLTEIDLNLFLKWLEQSKSKTFFADKFTYDLEQDKIKTLINLENAKEIKKSYKKEDIKLVEPIVNKFIELQNEEFVEEQFQKRSYIKLSLRKAMTECGNSNSN